MEVKGTTCELKLQYKILGPDGATKAVTCLYPGRTVPMSSYTISCMLLSIRSPEKYFHNYVIVYISSWVSYKGVVQNSSCCPEVWMQKQSPSFVPPSQVCLEFHPFHRGPQSQGLQLPGCHKTVRINQGGLVLVLQGRADLVTSESCPPSRKKQNPSPPYFLSSSYKLNVYIREFMRKQAVLKRLTKKLHPEIPNGQNSDSEPGLGAPQFRIKTKP